MWWCGEVNAALNRFSRAIAQQCMDQVSAGWGSGGQLLKRSRHEWLSGGYSISTVLLPDRGPVIFPKLFQWMEDIIHGTLLHQRDGD